MPPEASAPRALPRSILLWGVTLSLTVLAGCATSAPLPLATVIETPAASEHTLPEPTPHPTEPTTPEQEALATPPQDLLRDTLAYANQTLDASTTELAREIARLSEPDAADPSRNLRLALLLAQTRQPADTARALGLVQHTLADASAQELHALARLLEARLTQQRRLEEQLDRQSQQLRDVQRRNDQLAERLDAVRAIERSLHTRPAPTAAPASATAPAGGASGASNGNKP